MNKLISDRQWGYLLFFASLSCIFVATIFPFNFVFPQGFSGQFIIEEFNFGSSISDYLQNIFLFIPWGISLASILDRQGQRFWLILLFSLLVSALLSFSIELTQFFLPSRVSNLTDIIYNTLGGTLGGILYRWRINIIRFTTAILTGNLQQLSLKVFLLSIVGYCSIVILGIWVLLVSVNLSNWDDGYYLAIGNEITGDRPWQGRIHSLYICDRSLNSSEVIQVFEHKDDFFSQLPSLVTSLIFSNQHDFYQDRSQNIPNLSWQTPLSLPKVNASKKKVLDNNIKQNITVSLNQEQWLKTENAASLLSKKIKNANEFSLNLIVASDKVNQWGPARIMALSEGIYAQNMIVGQQGKDLNFRLRTPITGNNPTHPELVVPDVFVDRSFHQILITYAQKKLSFYIDRPDQQYFFKFNVFNSFFVYFPWRNKRWTINLEEFDILKYQRLFYLIITIPFVIFIIILLYYLVV